MTHISDIDHEVPLARDMKSKEPTRFNAHRRNRRIIITARRRPRFDRADFHSSLENHLTIRATVVSVRTMNRPFNLLLANALLSRAAVGL
jgi:hypothetical protein